MALFASRSTAPLSRQDSPTPPLTSSGLRLASRRLTFWQSVRPMTTTLCWRTANSASSPPP
eukprot:4961572-Prymnesium_polylepis.1